jgi:hypothetical protein
MTRSALDYLQSLPVTSSKRITGTSGTDPERLGDVTEFSVVDFEETGSREFLSAEQADEELVAIRFDFNLSTVIWTIRVPEESYTRGVDYFDEHFMSIEVSDGLASLEVV